MIKAIVPQEGTILTTPLSGTFQWGAVPKAASYKLSLSLKGVEKPLAQVSINEAQCRLPLAPEIKYSWSVAALDAQGKTLAQGGPFSFSTPEVKFTEITDSNVIFAGVHPGVHFVNMPEVPVDPNAQSSPWFEKKKFQQTPPPKYEEARARLPKPVWEGHDDAIDMYWYAWKVLFNVWVYAPPSPGNRAVSNMLGMPKWAGWGSTMVWDSAFILQFARYAHNAYPVITAIDNCYARQHENGFICRESENLNLEVYSGQPVNLPLLAWTEWVDYQVSGDADRLRRVLMPLVKQYEWYMLYQRRANGLYWGNRSAEGMDDSPSAALMHSSIGAVAAMAGSAQILADMAKIADRPDLEKWFRLEAKYVTKMMNKNYWDKKHQIYNDLNARNEPITDTPEGGVCKHGFDFWPLVFKGATPERAAIMAGHALDPKTFFMPSGIASLTADSKYFNPETGGYWRGSSWPPNNWIVIKGLEEYGMDDKAQAVAERYYDAFLKAWKADGDIREFLRPNEPKMEGCETFVGWGGIAPIAILIENLLGIQVNAPAGEIRWHIRQIEKHGVEDLWFGGKKVSLICEARKTAADLCRIHVTGDSEFKLKVQNGSGKETVLMIAKGENAFEVK